MSATPRFTRRLVILVLLTVAAGLVVTLLVVWPFTDQLAAHDLRVVPATLRGAQELTAVDTARTQLFQVCAGILAVLGFIYTARGFLLNRQQSELNRQTLELTAQGQVTDRYSRAVDQIGDHKVEVRVGGIYALERVARDSDRARDQAVVVQLLAAFIREHAPLGAGEGTSRADISAAIDVLAHHDPAIDPGRIILRNTDLSSLRLPGAILVNVDLSGSSLAGADLSDARLAGAIFANSDLTRARLHGADLSGAQFSGANLARAELPRATLRAADFTGAILDGGDFTDAHLERAVLADASAEGANFTGADLTGSALQEARMADATLRSAVLNGAQARGAQLYGAKMQKASLTSADLTGAQLTDADLSEAVCAGCGFTDAILFDTNLAGADLRDVDLRGFRSAGQNIELDGALADADAEIPDGWVRNSLTGRLSRRSADAPLL